MQDAHGSFYIPDSHRDTGRGAESAESCCQGPAIATTTPDPDSPISGGSAAGGLDHRTIDASLARSIAWTGLAKGLSQALSWASTLIVARLLTPADYGLVGMATLFFWAIQSLGEFGLGAAIIKDRTLSDEQIAQVNSVSVLFGLASTAVVVAAAGPLAVFFATPELHRVVLVTSLTFLVSGFRTVPSALLQRELRFKRLAANDTLQAVTQAATALVLAILGFGYWSLVVSALLGTLASTAGLVAARPFRFALPRDATIRGVTTMGREVVLARFGWYAMFNADFLVAGKLLGKAPLGNYSFAWTLASLPVEKVSLLVTRVSLPFFSAVQEKSASLRRYLLAMTEGLALVTFPAAIGIGLLAEDVVRIALGPEWTGAVAPLRILAFVAPLRSVATLLPQMTTVIGATRFGMWHAVGSAVVMAAGFLVGSRWGTGGIALAWVIAYPLALLPLLRLILATLECRVRDYAGALAPALVGSVLMTAVVLAVGAGLEGWGWRAAIRLPLQ
ncbi:MAG TPA: lipopolysaccharide biosynthesis protein, partial [Gemmatimonadales bacterium]|nr:lipopolysaccharide biosynthesis protein [Gemmatimonadales bacterium]